MQASSLAGVSLESATQLLDAVTSDVADFYETGVLDMAFVEILRSMRIMCSQMRLPLRMMQLLK